MSNDINSDLHILVVEDDARLRDRLARYLGGEGFLVTAASSAEDARNQMRNISPDLLVLDVMMPGESGLDLTRDLRRHWHNALPVLLLTARGAPEDRIEGFEAGADDYLPKPFEPRELVWRIKALLRRTPFSSANPNARATVKMGEAIFDIRRSELTGPNGIIRLTSGETSLLTALAVQANMVLSRDDIAAAVGSDDSGERAIDVQVNRLRRKIEPDPREPRYLYTVRGKGYILKPDLK